MTAASQTSVYSPFADQEKERRLEDKGRVVEHVQKEHITKEKLQHAVTEALETISSHSGSRRTAYVYYDDDVSTDTYPSAPNGASLTDSKENINASADKVGFFSNLTGKTQEKFKSNFPKGYEFLAKVFSRKEPTAKDIFEVFDGVCASLENKAYKNLPDFEKLCNEKAPGLENSLEELKDQLDAIKGDFKDQTLYTNPEGLSREETQAWLNKRSKVRSGLSSLEPAITKVNIIIKSLQDRVLNEEQSFSLRIITATVTALGYVASFFDKSGLIAYSLSHATNVSFESWQFSLKQQIKEWEAFKNQLEQLDRENPIVKGKGMNIDSVAATLFADSTAIFKTQTQISNDVKEQGQTLEAMQAQLNAKNEEIVYLRGELSEVKGQNHVILGELAELKQIINSAILSKA